MADKGLNCIRCHEGGALLAVGDDCGKTYVIKMNDWFVTAGKNDKALLTAVSIVFNDPHTHTARARMQMHVCLYSIIIIVTSHSYNIYRQMFDRETRREKIIEAKQRELKLKTKTSAKTDNATTKDKHAQLVETEIRMVQEAEKEFMELIDMIVSYCLYNNNLRVLLLYTVNNI